MLYDKPYILTYTFILLKTIKRLKPIDINVASVISTISFNNFEWK